MPQMQLSPAEQEAARLSRESARTDYFTSLPVECLTELEEDLRVALLAALGEAGGTGIRLSVAAQREEVRAAKLALAMPQGAGLTQWITTRASGEFSLIPDPHSGERVLCHAGTEIVGAEEEQILEEFYSSLPEHGLTEGEEILRNQVLKALRRLKGRAKLLQLTRGDQARGVEQAMAGVLPDGAPLSGWLERRLASEVEVVPEPGGGPWIVQVVGWEPPVKQVAELPPPSRVRVPRGGGAGGPVAAGPPPAWVLGPRGGGGSLVPVTPGFVARPPPFSPGLANPVAVGKQPNEPRVLRWRRDGTQRQAIGATVEEELLAEADTLAQKASLKKHEDREARAAAFYESLPDNMLTAEEQALREALFQAMDQLTGGGAGTVRLSTMCQDEGVRQTKLALLPGEVTVASWIEARIGGEILLSKDRNGQVMAEAADSGGGEPGAAEEEEASGGAQQPVPPLAKLKPEEREARMLEYFTGRALTAVERRLATCLSDVCARRVGEPLRLSEILNHDPAAKTAWQAAKTSWLALDPPLEASFARWVELRMPEQVLVTRAPFVQLTRPEIQRRGLGGKRPGGAAQAPPAKFPRGSNGLGWRPLAGMPGAFGGKGGRF